MANFTPQEIEQFLQEFFDVVGTRQYTGARYVPIFGRKGESSIEWNNTKPYEPLTIVLYQGNSYTSRQYVPVGVDILDADYWANTGNYNAQVELYREETLSFVDSIQHKSFAFDTVADMQESSELYTGAICHTNGFHESDDGGAAWYVISNTGIANEMDVLECGDLKAHVIITNIMTPMQIGAYGNGVNDDTQYINRLVEICEQIELGTHLITPSGTYTTTYASNVSYCINIDKKCTILSGTLITHVPCVAIYVNNCNNVVISNVKYDAKSTSGIHDSISVSINDADNVTVSDCNSNIACCHAYNSTNIKMYNNASIRDNANFRYGSAFGCYNSSNIKIYNNTVLGGTNDGDISVFGNSVESIVSGNYLDAYNDIAEVTTLQGICIDSGANNCKVINNTVKHYYYGIDVKTNVWGCIVTGNTAVENKVGISVRRSEANTNTDAVVVSDNEIALSGGNGNTDTMWTVDSVDISTIGILITYARGCQVCNNIIHTGLKTTSNVACILIYSQPSTTRNMAPITINGNFIKSVTESPYYKMTGLGIATVNITAAINIDTLIITNNTLHAYGSLKTGIYIGYCNRAIIKNNTVLVRSGDSHNPIKAYNNAVTDISNNDIEMAGYYGALIDNADIENAEVTAIGNHIINVGGQGLAFTVTNTTYSVAISNVIYQQAGTVSLGTTFTEQEANIKVGA